MSDHFIYVYLDTETTGLTPDDRPYQVAYAIETLAGVSLVRSSWLRHGVHPDDVSKYTQTSPNYAKYKAHSLFHEDVYFWFNSFRDDLAQIKLRLPERTPVHLVGANPHFDQNMLHAAISECATLFKWPWSHRLIDVESYHMGWRGLKQPKGLEDVWRDVMRDPEFKQSHNAVDDVQMLIQLMRAMAPVDR